MDDVVFPDIIRKLIPGLARARYGMAGYLFGAEEALINPQFNWGLVKEL